MVGQPLFWINGSALFLILMLLTLIGRPLAHCCPSRLVPPVKFFLAPALGLAVLVLLVSFVGRMMPFATRMVAIYLTLGGGIIALLFLDTHPLKAMQHASLVGLFGIICSFSLLAALFIHGGYSAHNDTFTYLAISDWLQQHAFNQIIIPKEITPSLTQVVMYQQNGFRMGGVYALGFFQALFHCQWAYTIYPSAVLVPFVACCLAAGLPVFLVYRGLCRPLRLVWCLVPGIGFGGLVFSVFYGFLSQAYGLAMAASTLFLWGGIQSSCDNKTTHGGPGIVSVIPLSMLFSALIVSYAELSPFIGLALVISMLIVMIRQRCFIPYTVYGLLFCLLLLLWVNEEWPRVIHALRIQFTAVVGNPITWPIWGYSAHMFGLHGGVWGPMQWSQGRALLSEIIGISTTICLVIFLKRSQQMRAWIKKAPIFPSTVLLFIFLFAFFYFRYWVPSPFVVGTGQSWSQFKLSEWAHPFASVFLILALLLFFKKHSKHAEMKHAWLLVVVGMMIWGGIAGIRKEHAVMAYYQVSNLDGYYKMVRSRLLDFCPKKAPIYLALGEEEGNDQKFRQLLTLFLKDKHLKADWKGDNYILPLLPLVLQHEKPQDGDCIVDAIAGASPIPINHIQIGILHAYVLNPKNVSKE